MRVRSILLLLCLLPIGAPAQEPPPEPPLDLSDEADVKDEILLMGTLQVSISADDIYRSEGVQDLVEEQARQMTEASQRRLRRQEARIEALKAQVQDGKASVADLKKAVAEMYRRIELAQLAIFRAQVIRDTVASARAQMARSLRSRGRRGTERFAGSRPFTPAIMRTIENAFLRQFRRPLPISAEGDTALHRALGFDHSGRVDVAVHPDHPEGIWLRKFLETLRVPYYGFRSAITGSATAPHIHIGPGSTRYRRVAAATPTARTAARTRNHPVNRAPADLAID